MVRRRLTDEERVASIERRRIRRREYMRGYYRRNREKRVEACRRWRERNREHYAAYQRAYREKMKGAEQ